MSKFKGRSLASIQKLNIPTCIDCGSKLRRAGTSYCDDCMTHIITSQHEEEPDSEEPLSYADVLNNV
jgi:tRNA(Ile2) C34 agmatinyltransferase TiaS